MTNKQAITLIQNRITELVNDNNIKNKMIKLKGVVEMLSKKDLKKYMWIVSVTKELMDMIPEENKKYIGYNDGKQGLNWKAYEVDLQANIQGKIVMLEGDRNLPKDTRVIDNIDTRTIKEMARLNRYNDKQLIKLIREGIIVGTFNY